LEDLDRSLLQSDTYNREGSISTQAELAELREELRKVSTILIVAPTDVI
jgi:hypothetical protein